MTPYKSTFKEATKEVSVIKDLEVHDNFVECWDELKLCLKKLGVYSYYLENPEEDSEWNVIFSKKQLTAKDLKVYEFESESNDDEEDIGESDVEFDKSTDKAKKDFSKIISQIRPKVLKKFEKTKLFFDNYSEYDWLAPVGSLKCRIMIDDRDIGRISGKKIVDQVTLYLKQLIKELGNDKLSLAKSDIEDLPTILIRYKI